MVKELSDQGDDRVTRDRDRREEDLTEALTAEEERLFGEGAEDNDDMDEGEEEDNEEEEVEEEEILTPTLKRETLNTPRPVLGLA